MGKNRKKKAAKKYKIQRKSNHSDLRKAVTIIVFTNGNNGCSIVCDT